MNNRLSVLLTALWISVAILINAQIKSIKKTRQLNLQIYSLVQTQPKDIIKIVPKYIYVPSEGGTEIKSKDSTKSLEEVVDIKIKKYGLTSKLGGQISIVPLGLGVDFKLAYFNRLGFVLGIVYHPYDTIFFLSPMVGLSYKLDRLPLIENTEMFLGYKPVGMRPIFLGLRINL